jgi:hypothetical protein
MKPTNALPREWLPKLSELLATGFQAAERRLADFHSLEILDWKYFAPRGGPDVPRSLVSTKDEKIVTHIGLVPTTFETTDPAFPPVSALHMIDWISSPSAGPAASALLMNALKLADVQYALGSSESARRVMLGFRYTEVARVPLYHSVLKPLNAAVWRELHGEQTGVRKFAFLALDNLQNLKRKNSSGPLTLRPVTNFGEEIRPILKSAGAPFIYTSREPALLNHLLAHPKKIISGWHIQDGNKLRGFALTSCFEKGEFRAGKIVDCFLDNAESSTYAQALSLVREELRKQGASVVSCYGSTDWMANGLRQAGFFRRGRTPLYLRDPGQRIPRNLPFHLTHLEADGAIQ